MAQAQRWQRRGEALDADPGCAVWVENLKSQSINPGTSADLTVATLWLAALLQPGREEAASRAWPWHGK